MSGFVDNDSSIRPRSGRCQDFWLVHFCDILGNGRKTKVKN
jgi:hypothetical protein